MHNNTVESSLKVYQERAIGVGTFIGGPLISGYMIAENFKAFNEPKKARTTWIITIVISVALFGTLAFIPDEVRFPNNVIPFLNIAIAYFLVQRFQKSNIISHEANGGQLYSWKRVIGVSLLGLLGTVLVIFSVAFLFEITTQ